MNDRSPELAFGPFRFDPVGLRLSRDGIPVPLQAKPAAVLAYLATNAGRVVLKQELLTAVWPGAVSPAVLKVAIRAIRLALGDTATQPVFLETFGRAGYRFRSVERIRPTPAASASASLVGRDSELERLRQCFAAARSAQRQLVFLTGEAGIGKTAVVDHFVAAGIACDGVAVGRGQCMEVYGEREAYMPILEALEDLCRGEHGAEAITVLRQDAPTWAAQLTGSLIGEGVSDSRLKTSVTRDRMQAELVSALEKLAAGRVVLLVLEDLHVSDPSTIEFLDCFSKGAASARIMILGTSRPPGLQSSESPFGAMPQSAEQPPRWHEIELPRLAAGAVGEYLRNRLTAHDVNAELADAVHRYTEGNPLFMVSMVEYLIDRGLLRMRDGEWGMERPFASAGIPENLRHMIKTVVTRAGIGVEPVLRVAAVQGYSFDSAVVARAAGLDLAEVERQLQRVEQHTHLVRRQAQVDLPGGGRTTRYRFAHVLSQNALYAGLESGERRRLSTEVAIALEELKGVDVLPSELAHLFEAGGHWRRAAECFLAASELAARKFAHREAAATAERGLAALDALEPTLDRARLELALEIAHGLSLSVLHGYSADLTGESMRRARRLCERVPESPQLHQALWGLLVYNLVAPELTAARDIGQQLIEMAVRSGDPRLAVAGRVGCGFASVHLGELLVGHDHLERGLLVWEPWRHEEYVALYGLDPGLYLMANTVRSLWLLGRPQQARRRMDEAVAAARVGGDPRCIAFAIHIEVVFRFLSGDGALAMQRANECNVLCAEHGIAQERTWTAPYLGCMIAAQGDLGAGIDVMRRGILDLREMQAMNTFPHFLALYGQLLAKRGDTDQALLAISEALAIADATRDHCYLAEVHRLRGEILLSVARRTRSSEAQADACFDLARQIARSQGATSWELRAVLSRMRLNESEETRHQLAEVVARFEPGADTTDLREARALL